ncbi:MAG: DUF2207 domain-containing protein [Actinobacteria bacterium]|nr:DUF2207 domain-containing protein [Actinomycetota bacterium]
MRKRHERSLPVARVILSLALLGAVFPALQGALAVTVTLADAGSPSRAPAFPAGLVMASPLPGSETRGQVGNTEKKWEFERFDSQVQVHDDGSFTVRETQVVNFTGSFSFLTRDIPARMAYFDEGRTYGKVRVKDVQVYNLDGTPYDGDLWEAENIYPYTDFTIDVSLPKGLIDKPWPYRASTLWLMLLLAAGCLLGAFLLMLALWFWRGRDAYGGPRPGVCYEPPRDERPAVVAMLMHQQPRMEDLAATVVDLAVRGKLRIIEDQEEKVPGRKSFIFERRDASTGDLLPYERTLMKGIFAKGERVEEDDLRLRGKFTAIMNGIRKEARKRKLFYDDPERTVGICFRAAMAMLLVPPLALFILHYRMDMGYLWVLLAGTVPAGIAIWVIGHAMPRRTALGSRLFWQAMGFREYLRTAEAGEPQSMTLQSFQENLPYAMVMGMADRWAALFADALTSSPDWYSGAGPAFSATRLTAGLSGMATALYTGGPYRSGSSGGSGFRSGFGGGGFGGGSSGGGFGGGGSSAG